MPPCPRMRGDSWTNSSMTRNGDPIFNGPRSRPCSGVPAGISTISGDGEWRNGRGAEGVGKPGDACTAWSNAPGRDARLVSGEAVFDVVGGPVRKGASKPRSPEPVSFFLPIFEGFVSVMSVVV